MKLLQLLIGILSAATLAAQDVVIYGGTPGGIAAAIAAARQGRSVALITPPHSPTPVPVLSVH